MGLLRLRVNLAIQSAFANSIFVLSVLIYPYLTTAALTGSGYLKAKPGHLVPDIFLYPNFQNPGCILIVEKFSQKAYLFCSGNIENALEVYPCSTGEKRGPKCNKNDKRTPEGVYFVTNSFREKDLSSIYGARAFPIDYPNPRDRKLGRTGYGIWIHGTNGSLKPWNTNGCIVFRNQDIIELAEYVSKKHTPIIVTKRIKYIEGERLEKEGLEVKKFIMDWLEAWQGGLIDCYMSFYSRDFTGAGKNWNKWRAYKKRLNDKYESIDLSIDNLQILRENGIVLAKFDQSYEADGFFSVGQKRLYLHKKGQKWKIVDEFFEKRKDFVQVKGPTEARREKNLLAIKRMISQWQQVWQDKEIQRYMTYYSQDFSSGGLNRTRWKKHKSRINKRYGHINITIRDLDVKLLSSERATASFYQEYCADKYQDQGRKTLQLIKRDEKWKIRREIWIPLPKSKK